MPTRRSAANAVEISPSPQSAGRLAVALALLQADARPDELEGMARFGIVGERRLGLSVPSMRRIAKTLGRDRALALELWTTAIPDAQIVAGMLAALAAIDAARRIQAQGSRSGRWIAADALRELASDAVQARLATPGTPPRTPAPQK